MLKLEKLSKTREISISLRPQERFFNRTLLKALSLAVGIHLMAAFFFEVRPFRVKGSQMVFPPIIVDADISQTIENPVVAELEDEEILPRLIKEPKGSQLRFPTMPKEMAVYRTERFALEMEPGDLLFAETEKFAVLPDMVMWKNRGRGEPKLQVIASGHLAYRKLYEVPQDLPLPNHPMGAAFSVQVDDQTGTIFWFDAKQRASHAEESKFAELVLRSLRFEPVKESFVTVGEVEIRYAGGRMR